MTTTPNRYISFYTSADTIFESARNKKLIEVCSVSIDNFDQKQVNVIVRGNVQLDDVRYAKKALDKEGKKYGYQINYQNLSGTPIFELEEE